MANPEETIFSLHENRKKLAWEKLFPSSFIAQAGDYIVNLLGDGSTDRHCIGMNFYTYVTFLSEAVGAPSVEIEELDETIDSAIAVLLNRHLIETWEDEEGAITIYYNLPEDDND